METLATIAIDSIAAGGDGVGRLDGKAVFVPRSAPGDVVVAAVTGRARFARGTLREVVRPSPDRVEPGCAHYTRDRCGGCQLQHLAYPAQLRAKHVIVSDALARIAKREARVGEPVAAPDEWRYRAKLTLALRRGRARWVAGLHPYDDPGRVFALADCPITDRRVVSTWREVLDAGELLPEAPALRGSVRWTRHGAALVIEGGRRWSAHGELFDRVAGLAALYWEPEGGTRRKIADRRADDEPAASFAQVHPRMAELLRSYVVSAAREVTPVTAVDAYAGVGDVAVALAAAGTAVTAIELDPDAARWGEQRLATPSRMLRGRVEEELRGALPADLVVLNPPRAGVDARVTRILADAGPARLIYVSCDPATLARDIARLPGYDILSVRPFDMFPQTAHVETVCVLARRAA